METKWKVFCYPYLSLAYYSLVSFSLVKDQTEWINQKQALRWLKKHSESDSVAKETKAVDPKDQREDD